LASSSPGIKHKSKSRLVLQDLTAVGWAFDDLEAVGCVLWNKIAVLCDNLWHNSTPIEDDVQKKSEVLYEE
jgi:hypothetical protein